MEESLAISGLTPKSFLRFPAVFLACASDPHKIWVFNWWPETGSNYRRRPIQGGI
jgi:hypothetical protein